jgi:hypothetical protein
VHYSWYFLILFFHLRLHILCLPTKILHFHSLPCLGRNISSLIK